MAVSFKITFDVSACKKDLKNVVVDIVEEWAKVIYGETIDRLFTREAKDDLVNHGVVKNIAGRVSAMFEGGAWFVMDEWGTGSKMAHDNPSLQAYKDSELWNEYRNGASKDNAIVTRKAGFYKNIFGDVVESKAVAPGINLEKFDLPYINAQEPSLALWYSLSIFNFTKKDYDELADRAFKRMNWAKYFKIKSSRVVIKI